MDVPSLFHDNQDFGKRHAENRLPPGSQGENNPSGEGNDKAGVLDTPKGYV